MLKFISIMVNLQPVLIYIYDGKSTAMEVDTGTTRTVISANTWRSLGSPRLNSCDLINLKTYSGENLKVMGTTTVEVKFNNQQAKLPVIGKWSILIWSKLA